MIGIFSIFGGFVMGAILFDQKEVGQAIRTRLHDFVAVFFLPIFFTYTGLRTDIGSVKGWLPWVLCLLVLLAASLGKFGGCALAARASGISWRDSAAIGVMMNTRALMELIVVNVGYDLGIIPRSVFFMLVVMAVTTTYITTPVLRRIVRGNAPAHNVVVSNVALSDSRFDSVDLDRLKRAVGSSVIPAPAIISALNKNAVPTSSTPG